MVAEWLIWVYPEVAAAALALRPPRRRPPAEPPRAPRRSALILNGAALAELKDELCVEEYDVIFRGVDELAFTIEKSAVSVYETVTNRDLADFAFVQIASFPNPTGTLLNAIAAYLRHQGVDAVNAAGIGAPTRLLQYVRFAQSGIPVPATRYLPPRLLADAYPDLADHFGLPFILTAFRGGPGPRDLLIRDESSFAEHLRAARHAYFLAREIIPADAIYRLLVLGHQVSIVMRQSISFGESCLLPDEEQISLVDSAALSPDARTLGVQAASLMELDVAEVRMVRHWMSGEWYVLETSATPPFSAGAFVQDKVNAYTAYLQHKLGAEAGRNRQSR
jgi:hypothetical protein